MKESKHRKETVTVCDMWYMICDMWYVLCNMWMWYVIFLCDMWICEYVICDMWYEICKKPPSETPYKNGNAKFSMVPIKALTEILMFNIFEI